MVILLFKKLYPNAVNIENIEWKDADNLNYFVDEIRIQTIALTITKSHTIQTDKYMNLRALNMSYLLQVRSNFTDLMYNSPDPLGHSWKLRVQKGPMTMNTLKISWNTKMLIIESSVNVITNVHTVDQCPIAAEENAGLHPVHLCDGVNFVNSKTVLFLWKNNRDFPMN